MSMKYVKLIWGKKETISIWWRCKKCYLLLFLLTAQTERKFLRKVHKNIPVTIRIKVLSNPDHSMILWKGSVMFKVHVKGINSFIGSLIYLLPQTCIQHCDWNSLQEQHTISLMFSWQISALHASSTLQLSPDKSGDSWYGFWKPNVFFLLFQLI